MPSPGAEPTVSVGFGPNAPDDNTGALALPAGYHTIAFTWVDPKGPFSGLFPAGQDKIADAFSQAVTAQQANMLGVVTANCGGGGGSAEDAVQVAQIAGPEQEVAAGIACAHLRQPESRRYAALLLTDERRYLMVVRMLDKADRPVRVFADVTHFVQAAAAAQP